MPTIAEIRQKYPQYQDMSDTDLAGALHKKFYADMPVDEFNAKIGLTGQERQQSQDLRSELSDMTQSAAPENWQRATVLPFEKNMATGETRGALPGLVRGLVDSGVQAVTLPGRAMSGEIQLTDPNGDVSQQAIAEGLNFAGWASPASPASRITAPAPQAVARAPQPLTEGRQAALAAERLGVDLPRAVASDRIPVQQAGKALTNIPVAGAPLRKASETAINQLDDAALRAQQGFGSGNVAQAGAAAREGITDFAKNTLGDAVKAKYDAVDELVQPNVLTRLENTAKAAAGITAKRQNANMQGQSRAVTLVQKALNAADGMNYQGIKDLRTSIGELLDDPQRLASAGISQSELKQVYGALSDDLKSAVSRSGGEKASKAFETANSFASRIAKEREALDTVLGKNLSDEKVFDRITAMAGSTSRADQSGLLRVRGAVGKEGWDEIASAVISRIGRDPDGNFTPDRFVTGYGKLSAAGKNALFGGNKELASSLDDIVAVSRRFKQMNQYANPSGTAQNALFGLGGAGLVIDPVSTLTTLTGGSALSKLLAKPVSAKKLAQWAKAYEAAATTPTAANAKMLGAHGRVLALAIANDAGNPGLAAQLLSPLSIPQKVKAGPENGPGLMELEQQGQPNNPRMLLPNEA